MKAASIAVVLSALCLTAFSRDALSGTWEQDRDQANECFRSRDRVAELQHLSTKLAYSNPTLSQLADESVPDKPELQSIRLRDESGRPCREMMLAATDRHHPLLTSAFRVRYFQIDLVMVKLLQQRISFGTGNRLMHESFLELAGRLERYAQMTSEAERQAQAERDRKLAEQARQLQETIDKSLPPGRLTTCHWSASMLVCNTL